jgi:hypothetical protein
MNGLSIPQSFEELTDRLRRLQEEGRKLSRPPRRSLTLEKRSVVPAKTDGRCHLCGGDLTGPKFEAGHRLAHAAGERNTLITILRLTVCALALVVLFGRRASIDFSNGHLGT